MAGYGAVIGAFMGAAGGALALVDKNRKEAEQRKLLYDHAKEQKNWFDKNYNEDGTQRADAQRLLTRTEEFIRQRNRAAEGRAAVMGGTDASVEDEKERNNQVMADAVSQIAARSDARKDALAEQYMHDKKDILDEKMKLVDKAAGAHEAFNAVLGGAANGMSLGSGLG